MTNEPVKRPGRKADPMTRIVAELKPLILKELASKGSSPGGDRLRLHAGRADAWEEELASRGRFDALLLSKAFRLLSSETPYSRDELLSLAAVVLSQVDGVDGK